MRKVYSDMIPEKGTRKDPFPANKAVKKIRDSRQENANFERHMEYDKYENAAYWANPTQPRNKLLLFDEKKLNWYKVEADFYTAKEVAHAAIM